MEQNIEHVRHSLAHLLAAAVLEKWPGTKQAIGPAIENGFYYDFDFGEEAVSEDDLVDIEKKMRQILKTWKEFSSEEVGKDKAKDTFKDNLYKHELVDEILERGEKLTLYTSGKYTDLCRGGHVENAEEINPKAFKLTHLAGAYWRGDEKNKMLTRIYGAAFYTKEDLDKYLEMLKEAKKRDHKKLGRELDLFTTSSLVGSGLPLWTPKGTLVRELLDDFVWELRKERGFEKVEIPHITRKELYEVSGHWDKFKDNLFKVTTREGHLFAIKPMNCPHHTQIYKRKQWSYRELPQKYANTTMVYRDEQSGELAGLARVRAITQDDAHTFCRKSQIKEEMLKIWDIVDIFYKTAGFGLEVRLSFHDPDEPEAYLGDKKVWAEMEKEILELAKQRKSDAKVEIGEAAFYGPKIDFVATDSLGRRWQVATIQLDMNMPERFNLTCIDEKGNAERIVMIHAAIMGAIERYLAILIEHTAGAFPVWLSPVQVRILAVSEKFQEYGEKALKEFSGIRAEISDPNETLGKRIRQTQIERIPYVLVVGEKEQKNKSVNVRHYKDGDLGEMKVDKFLKKISEDIEKKKS